MPIDPNLPIVNMDNVKCFMIQKVHGVLIKHFLDLNENTPTDKVYFTEQTDEPLELVNFTKLVGSLLRNDPERVVIHNDIHTIRLISKRKVLELLDQSGHNISL